jgi:hypothetical protein
VTKRYITKVENSEGREQWTDKFSERKQFTTEADAREEYIRYAGLVVNE